MRSVPVLTLTLLTGACYTYRPVTNAEPATGDVVRAELTAEGTELLARHLGPHIKQLDGEISSAGADSLAFRVRVARTPDGIESYFKDDQVSLPRTSVASILRRRFSPGSTAAVGGLFVAGAIGAAAALSGNDDNSGGGANPPGPGDPK